MPPKGERRKQQIIDTAKEMFIEKGFQSTHIGQVCEKLNIARGTVYQYFSNKKEILYALMDSVIEKIEDVLDKDDLQEFLGVNPPQDKIVVFIKNRISLSISMILSEPIVIKLIFKDIVGIDIEVVERVNRSVDSIKNVIAEEISELKNQGIFRDTLNHNITASMLVGGIMLMVYEYEKNGEDVMNQEVITSIVENYLSGSLK